ncbi:hypothetical protein ACN38_g12765 [Penicillium nordicum]|uniref:Thyroglobulin type-1 domain-containing protein n=1 Tax=Penicillium nordicum TaxID=229535 RepID=A0A0M9W9K3_9EURO|nr:hypothetical protein ACN38_g12765 [Penicillium nordicum]
MPITPDSHQSDGEAPPPSLDFRGAYGPCQAPNNRSGCWCAPADTHFSPDTQSTILCIFCMTYHIKGT